jgi:predicted dehydrogenase
MFILKSPWQKLLPKLNILVSLLQPNSNGRAYILISSSTRKIKEHLPRIGEIKHVDSQRLNWGIYQTKTTPLLSLLPHDVSILHELFTDLEVTSVRQRNFTNNVVPDWVSFDLSMGGYCHCYWILVLA